MQKDPNHDFIKRAWNERSCSIYHSIWDEMEQSERQKQPLALKSRENGKDEYKPRQVVITENETMNLITSKTRELKRTLYSETFNLKTVVRAFFSREGSTVREEIIADEQSSTEILKPDVLTNSCTDQMYPTFEEKQFAMRSKNASCKVARDR